MTKPVRRGLRIAIFFLSNTYPGACAYEKKTDAQNERNDAETSKAVVVAVVWLRRLGRDDNMTAATRYYNIDI